MSVQSIAKKLAVIATAIVVCVFSVFSVHGVTSTQSSSAAISFSAGNLTLDSVPSFDFGNQPIATTDMTYQASDISSALQITDARGSLAGWKITASLGKFQQGGADSLSGAKLTLTGGTASAIGGTGGTAPTVATPISLTSNGSVANVLTAAANNGGGQWQASWTATNAQLSVLGGNVTTGSHSAVLTWTLYDAP